MTMSPKDQYRYKVLNRLNDINNLAEELHSHLTQVDDWLFLSNQGGTQETLSCLQKASLCAAAARETLEALEKQIRKTELVTDRMKELH
jgi:hypothetical protein